jgi:hypothetical protein
MPDQKKIITLDMIRKAFNLPDDTDFTLVSMTIPEDSVDFKVEEECGTDSKSALLASWW